MRWLNTLGPVLGIVILTTDRKLRFVSSTLKGGRIMWTKPEATEMRFGFEVTMYVCNR